MTGICELMQVRETELRSFARVPCGQPLSVSSPNIKVFYFIMRTRGQSSLTRYLGAKVPSALLDVGHRDGQMIVFYVLHSNRGTSGAWRREAEYGW